MPAIFRASAPAAATLDRLGALQQLPGTWIGGGFNLIARPDHDRAFFLQLSATQEIIEFTPIGSPIPNRAAQQDDIEFLGLRYVHQVSDAVTKGALHIEPGLWLNLPATTVPQAPPSVVRLATIPHGDALIAQGSGSAPEPGPPAITSVSSRPFTQVPGTLLNDFGYLDPYLTSPLPPGIPLGAIQNPNLVLTTAIAKQAITQTVTLKVATTTVIGGLTGALANIPFVARNANATEMHSTFWIETVEHPDGDGQYLQLQYTQTVILNFLGIDWPHISAGTLVKQ
jgi:hypothetical protein